MDMTEAVLAKHLARLQLPYIVQHSPALMAQTARQSWSHGRFVEHLVAGEVARRGAALISRGVKAARLTGIKTPDGFGPQVQQLLRLDFLPRHGKVILWGDVGVGKTQLAITLATRNL